LSKARARAVLRYLNEKGGIDSVKLSSVGYGDTKPIASNATEVGRQQNRRVDIVLSPPELGTEQSGPSAKPVETGNNGSTLSRLSPMESRTPISAMNTATPVASADLSMVEPSSVPGNPASATMPPSAGQVSSDRKSDAPVAPPQ